MSTYDELFDDPRIPNQLDSGEADGNALLQAICRVSDAIREQTAEFRALRIAMTGADRSFVDTPGRAVYPFCSTCNCHHHPEDDNCILRGGMGAVDITTVRPAAESQEQNAADALAAAAAFWPHTFVSQTGTPEGSAPVVSDRSCRLCNRSDYDPIHMREKLFDAMQKAGDPTE